MPPKADLTLHEMLLDWRKRRKRWRRDPAPPRAEVPAPQSPPAPRPGGSSQYRGVVYNKARRGWMVTFRWQRKLHVCGPFVLEVDAAHAYDRKARELIGPEALTNFDPPKTGEQWT